MAAARVDVQLPGGTRVQVPAADGQALRVVLDTLARWDGERAGGGPC